MSSDENSGFWEVRVYFQDGEANLKIQRPFIFLFENLLCT